MNTYIPNLKRPFFGLVFFASAIMALLTTPVFGFKPEQTTLADQVERARLICLVEITQAKSPYSGNILQTLKAPEGFNLKAITFNAVSLRLQDAPLLSNGDKVLILLRETDEKKWELAAYGSQAVWPKIEKQWPYTDGHVASLEATVDTVKALLLPNSDSDESVSSLISSSIPLKRLVGLEIVARSDNPENYPLSIAEVVRKESDTQGDVSRLAKTISSKVVSTKRE